MLTRRLAVGIQLAAVALAGLPSLGAQEVRPHESFVVRFEKRSFDLTGLRQAIRRGADAKTLNRIVTDLESQVRADQAGFVHEVRHLGGRITAQWWLVNGCALDIAAKHLPRLRRAANVLTVEIDRVRRGHLVDAADNMHHGSAAANLTKDAAGKFISGQGVGVAVLDTGADVNSGTTNRPHACYYPGGNPSNNGNAGIKGSLLLAALKLPASTSNDDAVGHGTAVAACIGANKWNTHANVGNGVAPGTGIVSMNITDPTGLSKDSWIVTAWQTIVGLRATHNILVGNNSFSGEPSLANIAQRALDSAAYNGDLVITVSAGNFGPDTSESQYAFNGLAVGAIVKTTLVKANGSAIGPLYQSNRTYPDLTAVGAAVVLPTIDQESGESTLSGTSYAAPMVAGAAALVRQANPRLDANQVRALLLNTTAKRTGDRNSYGLGSLRADTAVNAALNGDVLPGAVTTSRPAARYEFRVATAGLHRITATWMRSLTLQDAPNLTLEIFDDQSQSIAKDANSANSYESIEFLATAGRTYRAEIRWENAPANEELVEFAIAGVSQATPPNLTSLRPDSITAYHPDPVELEGAGLASATEVLFGTMAERDFIVLDDTRIRVTPPNLLPIGPTTVRVKTPHGVSQPQTLRITAPLDPIMAGPGSVFRGNGTQRFEIYSGRRWRTLVLVSDSDLPSKLLNIYDLGIGNNWASVIAPVLFVNQDDRGASTFLLKFPASLPKTTVFLQAISTNPAAIQQPFPASNVLRLTIR